MLAEKNCKVDGCQQTDSWIRDLDGDTNLDIVQKKVKYDVKGNLVDSTITVYSLNKEGVFVENKQLEIDEGDYRVELER